MKRLIVAGLILFGVSSVAAQGYPAGCVPGIITITIGGVSQQSNNECAYIIHYSEQGYLPPLTQVSFSYFGNSYNGVIAGTQHTKKADGSETVEYMVVYVGEIGPHFEIKEVALPINAVNPI